ncbi:MAG: GT2 family glycosyltransferase [Paracoccaceae bacterium]|jgi:GT2 family glycosyltransferase
MTRVDKISAVAIGRNEGARLKACLNSLEPEFGRIVYVDSASSDDSVEYARRANVEVVELDTSQLFSAARGRNAGFFELQKGDLPEFVQFVDGDCIMQSGWVEAAMHAFKADKDLAIVTGWRSEIDKDKSVYNALCDFEWHRPAGDILTCGGDMMVRSAVFEQVGGFDATVIAAEDDEFCVRVRKSGWRIERLPVSMTKHDANMTHFSQWWQRAVRSGHGFAQVAALHTGYFKPERRRVVFYSAVLPMLALISALTAPWILLLIAAVYGLSYLRTAIGLVKAGLKRPDALQQAVFLSLSKVPNMQGMLVFAWRRLRHRKISIIEYK